MRVSWEGGVERGRCHMTREPTACYTSTLLQQAAVAAELAARGEKENVNP